MGLGSWFQEKVVDPVRSVGREIDPTKGVKKLGGHVGDLFDDTRSNIGSAVRSAGRSLEDEIFEPVTSGLDDIYKEHIRPWMSELGAGAAAIFGLPPQLGAQIGGLFEEGGLNGGLFGNGFADSASTQAGGYEKAIADANATRTMLNQAYAPYLGLGASAIPALQQELGIGQPAATAMPSNRAAFLSNSSGNTYMPDMSGSFKGDGTGSGIFVGAGGLTSNIANPNYDGTGISSKLPSGMIGTLPNNASVGAGGMGGGGGAGGGTGYQNPLLDKIQEQTMQKLFNQRTGSGLWSAGDTPGVIANALLEPAYKMQQDRIGNLMNVAGLGANSTGSMGGINANILGNIMNSRIGAAEALASGQQVRAAQRGEMIDGVGNLLGKVGGGLWDMVKNIFGGGGGGSSSGSGGSWNFDVFGSGDLGTGGGGSGFADMIF